MLIRPLAHADVPAVAMIEQAVQVSPWSQRLFEESLAHHDLGWVLMNKGQLLAYILVKPILREADILTLGVHPQHQRKGYAQALLSFVLTQFDSLTLEVRVSNLPAITLYQKIGFEIVGQRSQYYQDEDAWVMKSHAP